MLRRKKIIQDFQKPTENCQTVPEPKAVSPLNVEEHTKKIDRVLAACREEMADEIGALLGINVQLIRIENEISRIKDFSFNEEFDRQIIANLDVIGEIAQRSFLSIDLKDAILIGGRLLMLSDSELQMAVEGEGFNPDIEDAYGEIVNIISGVLTAVFEKEYTKQIRFINAGLQQYAPTKMEPFYDGLFAEQEYYVSSMKLGMGENEFGMIHIFFPADMLQLENFVETVAEVIEKSSIMQPTAEQPVMEAEEKSKNNFIDAVAVDDVDNSKEYNDILLIGDDEVEIVKLRNVLGSRGYVVRVLSLKENVYDFITRELKAVYLVTRKIDEQALGVAIKVSSACSLPIIAAAPGWTRSKVLKAVKYGVRDILLTPADMEDIEKNIVCNLTGLAG